MLKNIFFLVKNSVMVPLPSSITYMWNFGSLLGLCLFIQIGSGLFLSLHYNSNIELAFSSVIYMMNDVNHGWILRVIHANGVTMMFIFMYIHIARGLYYKSYKLTLVWLVGILILLLTMGTAFLGYVLPWGQMSFWGAMVITNLISTIPYLGVMLVEWVWGGFSVSEPTLTRFFSFHFILPFVILGASALHVIFLHKYLSSNPLGLPKTDMISFHPFFTIKDILGVVVFMFSLLFLSLTEPYKFMDPDNFILANSMVTPVHIQPEWYFLFAYSILRAVPNKLGGVIGLLMSILVLALFFFSNKSKSQESVYYKSFCWVQFSIFMLLTWTGSLPVESPFLEIGQCLSLMYFLNMFLLMYL
uniref:Cytochrome b n=1 Tax=Heterodoxus spiniger TaxID=762516 RepID=A0A7T1HEY3_9NEOP|nr:cytochrome b [Heterodoxus spiniger]